MTIMMLIPSFCSSLAFKMSVQIFFIMWCTFVLYIEAHHPNIFQILSEKSPSVSHTNHKNVLLSNIRVWKLYCGNNALEETCNYTAHIVDLRCVVSFSCTKYYSLRRVVSFVESIYDLSQIIHLRCVVNVSKILQRSHTF